MFRHVPLNISNAVQYNGASRMAGEILVGQPLVPPLENLVTKPDPARRHPPNLFRPGHFLCDFFPFPFVRQHIHAMGGFHPGHIGPLLLDNLPHGPVGLFGIHVAKLPPINHEHFAGLFLGLVYPLNELPFQFAGILMKPGSGKKQLPGVMRGSDACFRSHDNASAWGFKGKLP